MGAISTTGRGEGLVRGAKGESMAVTKKVRILRNVVAGPNLQGHPGDEFEIPARDAQTLVAIGKAEYVSSAKDKATSKKSTSSSGSTFGGKK